MLTNAPDQSINDSLQPQTLLQVLQAIKKGDFSVRMPIEQTGLAGKIADTLNDIIDLHQRTSEEYAHVSKMVGKDGRINQRINVPEARGAWAQQIESINSLVTDLAQPTTEMARVIGAVARGDLSQSIPLQIDNRPLQGEFLRTATIVNTMVDQLNLFASEVTRVAREVGTEGKLGGQAKVRGVAGTWKDLTDNVNLMANNLTSQVRNIAEVSTAIATGDLSKKITADAQGEILELKSTINTMVDRLNSFASEVTRVAREVGTEGKLGGQAAVGGVEGTWKDLTDNVNLMANNLTSQVRNIAEVSTAIATGDLSKKITADAQGEILELKSTINTMVDRLNSFASEVTRVAREVGTEGKLGGQAAVEGVAGTWKDLTDNVNLMASNLTGQVRNIAEVSTAIATGDLSKKITADAQGEILELKSTINTMVDQLNSFASEVTRVAREVGTEGKLGGQAAVEGVAGTWKDLTDNVNLMASNLTGQVRNIAEVSTAIATGDLSKKITADAQGEILQLKSTINTMVDRLNSFASEVTRVAREVGTEGKLGGQAAVEGVAGTWRDLTDNVNLMASNLTGQVRNIAEVSTAIATGDLSKKITADARGEILELKNTINTMVDQLNSFASEVTRVAREVGTEGKLGGQAAVEGVAGTWKDLTDNVNLMASNLTGQVRNIAEVSTAIATGDLSKKITADARGEILELKNTINTMVDQLNSFASEVTRVAREVGTEGKLGGQAAVEGVAGTWKDLTDNVNLMANNLTSQVRNIAEVSTAIATGDLSKKITADAQGEILELKSTINTMVDQLNSFASEVTRVARDVGTEGKLGGQAAVEGVAGTWKDLTDNVNSMANNLTDQVRGIARIVTAVATGDLTRKLTLDAKGEIAALADTINELTYTLATFADQVSTVAREVGIEGKLGGQAKVPGASGTWRDLTDNVNQLAANLTTQIRTIAEIATAVTKGDLTRSIAVEAQGEVAELKDNINQMIANLRDTTKKNTEQDWLKTNLARFTRMLQGQRELEMVSRLILSELAPLVFAHVGLFYLLDTEDDQPQLKLLSSYAFRERKQLSNRFRLGEGLIGQCALEKERILLTDVPTDYIKISSGVGEATPLTIVALPVLFEGEVKAVIELASFHRFSEIHLNFLDQLTESIAIVLNTIGANTRTEELLKQSQSLAEELQGQQRELTETNQRLKEQARSLKASEELLKQQREQLQQTNEELEEKAELLARQNTEVERKNTEIELARQAIEEKAEQLAISSKYKSEFLANMSHELRTPLNSMLILSKLLSENHDHNLTPKQIEFAQTIYASGTDLLSLINEILDLAKIESGTMSIEAEEVRFNDVWVAMEQTFAQIAQEKGLKFMLSFDSTLPGSFYTDNKRLLQILRNLLSNAFKFTHQGSVELQIRRATDGWSHENQALQRADEVIAFAVADTGIGISPDKQQVIFEAFQQADGTTSRKYGGTGLGLSISREIARLLGGQITLASEPGKGSIFTVFLPMRSHVSSFESTEPRLLNGFGLFQEVGGQRPLLGVSPRDAHGALPVEYYDDRHLIMPGDRVLLIIEEDAALARILLNGARQNGFRGIVALRSEQGLALAQQFKPTAITLNMNLPAVGSWTLLDRLKYDPATRHIPIQLISGRADRQSGLQLGTAAHLHQPVVQNGVAAALAELKTVLDGQARNILVVEHDTERREQILTEIGHSEMLTHAVSSGDEALRVLQTSQFDCMLITLELPDMSGFELIRRMQYEMNSLTMPIVIYTNQGLDAQQVDELRHMTDTVTMKHIHTPERLLAETALFLHRVTTNLSYSQRDIATPTTTQILVAPPQKVLLVDDDIRNIFALASVLERYDMEVLYVENGLDAIRMLEQIPDIDVILMDVMIPELDGYETMRAIRGMPKYRDLPIIALTAKAMQGDRERCLAAGASDYITKPVDTERLLSLLHVAPLNPSQPKQD